MMLCFISTFLVIATGIAYAEDCSEHVADSCSAPFFFARGRNTLAEIFPETKDELLSLCSQLKEYLECAIEFEGKCGRETKVGVVFLEVTKDVCDEDTSIHAAIADNLVCLKNHFTRQRNFECDYPDLSTLKRQAKVLEEQGLDPSSEEGNPELSCMIDLHYAACKDRDILDNCGEDALNAYFELLGKFSGSVAIGFSCTRDDVRLRAAMVRLQKLENEVEEIFERRK